MCNSVCVVTSPQRPSAASQEEMTRYHSDEYIRFLRNIRPDNVHEYTKLMQRCKSILNSCVSYFGMKFVLCDLYVVGVLANILIWILDMFFSFFSSLLYVVNVGEDCPVFDGLYEFCQLSAGGSIGKAMKYRTVYCKRTCIHYMVYTCDVCVCSYVYIGNGRCVITSQLPKYS